MNNWEIYNAENMIGDTEISEMEFYSTMTEDEKNSKVDDTSEETPVEEASEASDTKPAEEQVESSEGSEVELEDSHENSTEEIPAEKNIEREVEAKSTDSIPEESTTDEVAEEADEIPTEIEMDPETVAKMVMQTKVVQATYNKIRNDLPEFRSGDTISVGYRVIEGSRSRIQSFDGVVIKIFLISNLSRY